MTASAGGDPAVVYITGWGRSGSTVLNRIVAREGVLGLGEVRRLWRRGIGERQDCSCGKAWDACDVWSHVVRAIAQTSGKSAEECAKEFDRAAFTAGKLATVPGGLRLGDASKRYVAALRELYLSAAEASGTTIVVDSSKDPTHALLARRTGLPVSVVHLVRDPRAVVWSHRRRKSPPAGVVATTTPTRPAAFVAARWLVRNAFIDARVRPDLRLRYEDLISDPDEAIRRIFLSVGREVPEGRAGSEHVIAGNPSRFERGPLLLKVDDEWTRAQPAAQQLLTSAITAPLLGKYGYPYKVRV
ncbi:MAG: sulfotransferase [Aeromicrobium sp.]